MFEGWGLDWNLSSSSEEWKDIVAYCEQEEIGTVSLQKAHWQKAIKVACKNGNLQKYEDSKSINSKWENNKSINIQYENSKSHPPQDEEETSRSHH